MMYHFDNGSFWFQDTMVQVNKELIHHIIGLPYFGNKIDLKEEVKFVGKEIILQNLYPGCEEGNTWNKSNGFIIN